MIVDAHHHLWDLSRGYRWLDDDAFAPIRRDFGVSDLLVNLASAGVDRTVLVEAGRCDVAEVKEFLAIADATEQIVGVVGWADVADPALADVLAAHRAGRGGRWLVGVRAQVQHEPDPHYLARPDVHRGLAAVAEAGLAFDLVVRGEQIAGAAAAVRAVPQAMFVVDHLGYPPIRDGLAGLPAWRDAIAPLAGAPNVVAKLSGLVTVADRLRWTVNDLRPWVLSAVELFGPGRLMFGSDWPVCLVAAAYPRVKNALDEALGDLGRSERAAIFSGTAIATYGLDL
jgi:L-fuconolactonase